MEYLVLKFIVFKLIRGKWLIGYSPGIIGLAYYLLTEFIKFIFMIGGIATYRV